MISVFQFLLLSFLQEYNLLSITLLYLVTKPSEKTSTNLTLLGAFLILWDSSPPVILIALTRDLGEGAVSLILLEAGSPTAPGGALKMVFRSGSVFAGNLRRGLAVLQRLLEASCWEKRWWWSHRDLVGLRSPGSFKERSFAENTPWRGGQGEENKQGRVGVRRPAVEGGRSHPRAGGAGGATGGHAWSWARREQEQGTPASCRPPSHLWPAPPTGQSPPQAASKGGGLRERQPAGQTHLRAESRWAALGMRDSGEHPERTQPGATPRDPRALS